MKSVVWWNKIEIERWLLCILLIVMMYNQEEDCIDNDATLVVNSTIHEKKRQLAQRECISRIYHAYYVSNTYAYGWKS